MANTHTGKGGRNFFSPNYRVIITCLGLLNVVLLIVAIAIGIKCAKVKEGSVEVSHSVAAQVISELNLLRSNHSDVMEAEEEAKNNLERERKKRVQLKEQIEQKRTANNEYQKQLEALVDEKRQLKNNLTYWEGSCGKCLPGWILMNSSCYFLSSSVTPIVAKSWSDSRADCISRGADLAVIGDPKEERFLSGTLQYGSTYSKAWIGATYNKTTKSWGWINNVTEVDGRYLGGGFDPTLRYGSQLDFCASIQYAFDRIRDPRNRDNCLISLAWICEMMST